jgi:hypothetical protein
MCGAIDMTALRIDFRIHVHMEWKESYGFVPKANGMSLYH